MRLGPICIITSSGMQCMSSPIRTHTVDTCYPEPLPPGVTQAARDELLRHTSHWLTEHFVGLSDDKAEAIAAVAGLMAWSTVFDPTNPFTIIKAQ
jgi:hypothetical protein